MKKLFSCLTGSALYGTRTPTSDRDIKHIVLPDLNDLLLGKKVSNKVYKTNEVANTRNTKDDVDEELIPLQVFARDFMMGQTYALELAFAIEGNHAEQQLFDPRGHVTRCHGDSKRWVVSVYDAVLCEVEVETPYLVDFIKELRTKFLTSNIKAMMDYVVNQASLYSFKGERLNVSRELLALLKSWSLKAEADQALADLWARPEFQAEANALQHKYPKYFKITEYDIGEDRMRPCFKLLEKTFPFTNTVVNSLVTCKSLINKYGSRADQASASNVDWKATMHALRIIDEGIQLLTFNYLEFPFSSEYAQRLLAIKRGEVPLAEITAEISAKVDQLKQLELETSLLDYSEEMQVEFDRWLIEWLRRFYGLTT